jgi:hypothetical protein
LAKAPKVITHVTIIPPKHPAMQVEKDILGLFKRIIQFGSTQNNSGGTLVPSAIQIGAIETPDQKFSPVNLFSKNENRKPIKSSKKKVKIPKRYVQDFGYNRSNLDISPW